MLRWPLSPGRKAEDRPPDWPPLAPGRYRGTGPFFGEKARFSDEWLAENTDLSPSRMCPLLRGGKKRTIPSMKRNMKKNPASREPRAPRPFRGAMLRGLAVLTPPLLTVLIIVWAINTTKSYLLAPVTDWARETLVWSLADVREDLPPPQLGNKTTAVDGRLYRQLENETYIPDSVYERVRRQTEPPLPTTAEGFYRRYVDLTYLRPHFAIPLFLAVFVLFLYFLGKFMAAGIGGFFGNLFERLVLRLPGVRAVYSAVKQVSDFVFTQRDIRFTRIVAVEYPRKGIWSMGFVTSESMASIFDAAGEPVLAVLIPYSPLPVTGCTITVRKRDCVDLDITFEQACQFIVSCGVVIPPRELRNLATEEQQTGKGKKE